MYEDNKVFESIAASWEKTDEYGSKLFMFTLIFSGLILTSSITLSSVIPSGILQLFILAIVEYIFVVPLGYIYFTLYKSVSPDGYLNIEETLIEDKILKEKLIESTYNMMKVDDAQFDLILENFGYSDRSSPSYLFNKYRYRVISFSYIIVAYIIKNKGKDIDQDGFDDWKEELQILAIQGNGKEIPKIDIDIIKPLLEESKIKDFHKSCAELITLHLSTVSDKGSGKDNETGMNLYSLYVECLSETIGEIDDMDRLILHVSGHVRGQTNFVKELI